MLRELGQELRAAREKQGVSIADVQAETKIRSRYLEAIEQGRFDILPGDVYTKGFLKTYAEFLGLDGHAMVERYKKWEAEQEEAASAQALPGGTAGTAVPAPAGRPHAGPPPDTFRVSGGGSPTRRRGKGGLWAGLALLLVASLAVGGWLAWRSGQEQGRQVTPPVQQAGGAGSQAGGPGGPSSSGGQPPAGNGQAPAPPETPVLTLEAGAVTDQFVIPFAVRGSASKPLQLTLTVSEGCWIRLQRTGQPTVEETVPAGASRTWEFTGEVRLKLGNPPVARMQVSGVAVPDPTVKFPVTYVFTQAQ